MRHVTAAIAALLRAAFPPHTGRRVAGAPFESAPSVPAALLRAHTAHSVVETKGRPRTRRIKACRVRRYARAIPVLDFDALPAGGPDVPDPVRPYVRLWEQKREAQRVEADRCGIADPAAAGGVR